MLHGVLSLLRFENHCSRMQVKINCSTFNKSQWPGHIPITSESSQLHKAALFFKAPLVILVYNQGWEPLLPIWAAQLKCAEILMGERSLCLKSPVYPNGLYKYNYLYVPWNQRFVLASKVLTNQSAELGWVAFTNLSLIFHGICRNCSWVILSVSTLLRSNWSILCPG